MHGVDPCFSELSGRYLTSLLRDSEANSLQAQLKADG